MPRFFVDPSQIGETTATITGEDANHMSRSLRMKIGDEVTLCDQQGYDYDGNIVEISNQFVVVEFTEKRENISEPKVEITLYQALPKGDKMEFIVQKATELGITAIVPILTSRCISRPKGQAAEKKTIRYERIAEEASKQSQRGKIPVIQPLISYEQALVEMQTFDNALLYYENAEAPVSHYLPLGKKIAIMIGSEGGFAPEEIEMAEKMGISIVQLGKRILRCETAPIVALSTLLYELGDL